MDISFLVQLTDRRGRDLTAPQGFSDVLHATHRYTCQVHLDKRFFYTALSAAIPLDDGSLKGYALEPRHMERDVAGGRGEVAVIVTAAIALTSLTTLVARSLRQQLRFFFQQLVQCLFYASAN